MTAYTAFNYGGISFPLGAVDGELGMLPVADPGLQTILDFGTFCLSTYLGNGLVDDSIRFITAAGEPNVICNVAMSVPMEPTLTAKVEQLRFPLFAVWRKSARYDWRTTNWRESKAKLGCAYILPPMSPGQAQRVLSVLNAAGAILDYKFAQGFDPSYLDGETVWTENGIAKVEVVAAEFGRVAFGSPDSGVDFHAWIGDLEVTERVMPTEDGLSDYGSADTDISDGSVDPNDPIEVADVETDLT